MEGGRGGEGDISFGKPGHTSEGGDNTVFPKKWTNAIVAR